MAPSTFLFFDGLAPNVSSELLFELCAAYGRVLNANAFLDDDEFSLGAGYVEMDSFQDATQAVHALDGSMVRGRVIGVTLISPL